MPGDVFWTGLFALSGAIVGGGAGYVTARLQHTLQIQQLTLEERKLSREELQQQLLRGDSQWERHRLIHLSYLNSLDGFINPAADGTIDRALLQARFDRLMEAHCELELGAGVEVNAAAYSLNDLVEALNGEIRKLLTGADSGQLIEAVKVREAEIRSIRRELVTRMRHELDSLWPAEAVHPRVPSP
jgi:hypothetical protein